MDVFYDMRDEISGLLKACSRDIQVVVYVNGVFDRPLAVTVGPGTTRLQITIERNGTVTYCYTKETMAKLYPNALEYTNSIVKNILGLLVKKSKGLTSIVEIANE